MGAVVVIYPLIPLGSLLALGVLGVLYAIFASGDISASILEFAADNTWIFLVVFLAIAVVLAVVLCLLKLPKAYAFSLCLPVALTLSLTYSAIITGMVETVEALEEVFLVAIFMIPILIALIIFQCLILWVPLAILVFLIATEMDSWIVILSGIVVNVILAVLVYFSSLPGYLGIVL